MNQITMDARQREIISSIETACRIWFNPHHTRTMRDIDQLPIEEREQLWADMSGDKDLSSFTSRWEDPEDVDVYLRKLEVELDNTRQNDKEAFLRAENVCPQFTCNRQLRLRFLRTERFDAKAAAARIIRHFHEKRVLFGDERLCREIKYSDLSSEEHMILRSGVYQVSPERDKGGRKIVLFWYKALNLTWSHDSVCRAQWYVMSRMAFDEQVQSLGIVKLVFNLECQPNEFPYQLLLRSNRVVEALNFRHAAQYVVAHPSLWDHVFDAGLNMMSPSLRLRTRLVTGSRQECDYKLMCLGIPHTALPFDRHTGIWDSSYFYKWLEYQRAMED